jgi:hypothetical protein
VLATGWPRVAVARLGWLREAAGLLLVPASQCEVVAGGCEVVAEERFGCLRGGCVVVVAGCCWVVEGACEPV